MKALLQKEYQELLRSYRLLYVPLIFLLLALGNIILFHMLPDLIASGSANLPEGTVIQIPPPTALDAVQKVLSQFDQFGALILILAFMGMVAGERSSGVMTTILVKPVSRIAYIGAKLMTALSLTLLSYGLSMGLTYVYGGLLFEDKLDPSHFLMGSFLYAPKLLVLTALILFCSTLLRSSIGAGGLALGLYMAMSLLSGFGIFKDRLPTSLGNLAASAIQGNDVSAGIPLLLSAAAIVLLACASCFILSRQEAS